MPRPPNLIPSKVLNLALPLDLHTQLSLHLYSELEMRVPHAAYSRFLSERIREYFNSSALDLAPFCGCAAESLVVRGTPQAIAQLSALLMKGAQE